jgi:hypothetical protein
VDLQVISRHDELLSSKYRNPAASNACAASSITTRSNTTSSPNSLVLATTTHAANTTCAFLDQFIHYLFFSCPNFLAQYLDFSRGNPLVLSFWFLRYSCIIGYILYNFCPISSLDEGFEAIGQNGRLESCRMAQSNQSQWFLLPLFCRTPSNEPRLYRVDRHIGCRHDQ